MIFLKLGGSLITEKAIERKAHQATIERLAMEIASYLASPQAEPILLGHGSGSFGHHAAARYQTHKGASTNQDWHGVSLVWQAAAELNQIVTAAIRAAGLEAISFAPSASALCQAGKLISMAHEPIVAALAAGLLPIVYGDVAFDTQQGASIVSTEAVFSYLAEELRPSRILLAGLEAGIYRDYPTNNDLIAHFYKQDLVASDLAGSSDTDVTGGMLSKVQFALELKASLPKMEIQVFSGKPPDAVLAALGGDHVGTMIEAD